VRISERIDGNFETGFEGRTVRTDIEFDGFDRRHNSLYMEQTLCH